MQQSLGPFDGTDPTYTTEDFLNDITANMVMTAGSIGPNWPGTTMVLLLTTRKKRTGKQLAVNFKRHLIISSRKHKQNYY